MTEHEHASSADRSPAGGNPITHTGDAVPFRQSRYLNPWNETKADEVALESDDIYTQIRAELYPDGDELDGREPIPAPGGGDVSSSDSGENRSEWLTLAELGKEIQVSPNTLYKWRARGDFPAHTRLPNGQTRVHRDDLYAWMHRRRSS